VLRLDTALTMRDLDAALARVEVVIAERRG
jgi:hypothetical protein